MKDLVPTSVEHDLLIAMIEHLERRFELGMLSHNDPKSIDVIGAGGSSAWTRLLPDDQISEQFFNTSKIVLVVIRAVERKSGLGMKIVRKNGVRWCKNYVDHHPNIPFSHRNLWSKLQNSLDTEESSVSTPSRQA